ncbi:hypothetical protein HF086_008596 [Spodoptera exigua]|uniref:Uncharacterized protein n=1 Tax=Spodoptera exigua TaxID=7107 RepID=A0A922S969_SPOEX|nr:hypothetical protein HF086_008596 [Spodoptera exigua]
MIDIPITTYTHFDFNKTLDYPSITVCKDPPYKYDKIKEYGLYGHPSITSEWIKFDFENNNLDEVWDNITFNANDIFVQYGLEGYAHIMGFNMGRCYTMSPKIVSKHVSQGTGYAMTMRHIAREVETTVSIIPPGYHVYIHYTKEPFTEVRVYNGGMVEYLYLNVGETLRVKVTVDEYKMISSSDDPCINRFNYSANELYVNFNSMMVSVYEERYNYDWNLFVSDLGGSIGFLLGLSVIGLMQIFGKTWRYFIKPFIKCDKKSRSVSITSATTADVKTIRQEYIDTWNDNNTAFNKF